MLMQIDIYLEPETMAAASHKEVAAYLGITLQSFKGRLKRYGVDSYMSYFPGNIPRSVIKYDRKIKEGKSLIGSIEVGERTELSPPQAKRLVFKLIERSKSDYLHYRCETSRRFLLNENGMLEWYLEAWGDLDHDYVIEKSAKWVNDVDNNVSE